MNKKEKILIGVLAVVIILAGGWLIRDRYIRTTTAKAVDIIFEKKGYSKQDMMRITIKNNLMENICFSSCYPYYMEKKQDIWMVYNYEDCQEYDLSDKCIEGGESGGFELSLADADKGIHRLVISVCRGCSPQQKFKENARIYSEEFVIYQ